MIVTSVLAEHGYTPRCVVHVGAHQCQETDTYFAAGVPRIFWVEADPRCAATIRERIAGDPRQALIEGLAADIEGNTVPFHVFSNEGASSSIYPATDLLLATWPGVAQTGEVLSLKTARLDSLLASAGLAPGDVDVIVFDVQGAEIMAMSGAGAFLEQATYVEAKVSKEPIYAGAPLADEVIAHLADRGFQLLTEVPWHGDAVFYRVSNNDAQAAFAMFHSDHYLSHNYARLVHLASLRLPLPAGSAVLEPGAGIGDHSLYYLERGCRVTSVEPRPENVAAYAEHMAELGFSGQATIIEGDVAAVERLGTFDVIHNYGLLYHLADPAVALATLGKHCTSYMVLETCVSFGEESALNPVDEPADNLSQAVEGRGCRPTRQWVWDQLVANFPYVYATVTQPDHPEFPLDWSRPQEDGAAGLSRSVFVASRRPLDLASLVDELPMVQTRMA